MNRGLAPALALLLAATTAHGAEQVWKYDQFHEDLGTAASQIQGTPLATQPGWVKGEALGQLYRPTAWPVKITGAQMFLAAPPNAPNLTTHAWLEFYFSDSDGPDPGKATPDWKIHTSELLNPATLNFGLELKGNTALEVTFDWDDAEGHPPMVTEGNIWFVIRFDQPSQDLSEEWGTFQCSTLGGLACGCQKVGSMHDQSSTLKANVMHYISPAGSCSGTANKWSFMESVGVTGDLILRLVVDAPETCTPACGDKACGDDGCGGSCGTCGAGQTCSAGACVATCAPSCDGMACGDDGCGGSCGTCSAGQTCSAGACVATCAPSCDGKTCGPDGCGGSCGACGAGQVCNAGQCEDEVVCEPDCDGKECGDDGCGGSCGTCGEGQTCAAGMCDDVTTCTPDCVGLVCGDDGCGGSCGSCPAGQVCSAGACASDCEPSCEGVECGSDGCGGSCGTCGAGEACDAGACAPVGVSPAPVQIDAVSPDFAFADRETPITITGKGFQAGLTAKIGATTLGSVRVTGSTLVEATVPKGMEPGEYMVLVINPDDSSAFVDKGFEIRAGSCGDGACAAGETCASCPVDCGLCDAGGGGSASDGCAGANPGFVWLWLLIPFGASLAARRRRDA